MYASLHQLHHLPWTQYGHYGEGTLFLQYHICYTDLAPVRLKHSKCNGWFISRFKGKTLSTQINYTYVYIYIYICIYINNIYIYIYILHIHIYTYIFTTYICIFFFLKHLVAPQSVCLLIRILHPLLISPATSLYENATEKDRAKIFY